MDKLHYIVLNQTSGPEITAGHHCGGEIQISAYDPGYTSDVWIIVWSQFAWN